MMKKAKITAIEFEVVCPHCNEACCDPRYGSHRWTTDETKAGQVATCSECGKEFEIPAKIPAIALSHN